MSNHVLMLSLDASLLAGEGVSGDARERHILYARELARQSPGSKLVIIAYTPNQPFNTRWISDECLVIPSNSSHRWIFSYDVHRIVRMLECRYAFSTVTTQSPFDDGWIGMRIARRLRARFIPQLRGDFYTPGSLLERFPLFLLLTPLSISVLHRADSVQVVARRIAEKLTRLGIARERIFEVPSAITFQAHASGSDGERQRFRQAHGIENRDVMCLSVGRLTHQKNIPFLLRIAHRLLAAHRAVRFVVIGDGPDRALIERHRSTNPEDQGGITHLGVLPYSAVAQWYAAADIFVLTSRYEGLARVLREAAASALPIVTTDVSGAHEVVVPNESGFIIPQGDADAFVHALERLIGDATLRRAFGQRGRHHEQRTFSTERIVAERVRHWYPVVP